MSSNEEMLEDGAKVKFLFITNLWNFLKMVVKVRDTWFFACPWQTIKFCNETDCNFI